MTIEEFANYGIGGLMFLTVVIPLALYILRDKDKQIVKAENEVVRMRGELAELRQVLDPIAPAITEMSRTMGQAITLLRGP